MSVYYSRQCECVCALVAGGKRIVMFSLRSTLKLKAKKRRKNVPYSQASLSLKAFGVWVLPHCC